MTLEIANLTGGYANQAVIRDVSFQVDQGQIVGLIGLNGAGKSTIIKHIMGLMDPFSGTIKVNYETLEKAPNQYRKKIAYIPETPLVYRELTLKEHFEIIALAYDLPKETIIEKAMPLLKKFRLENRLDWFPDDFSKGMQQKVMIISALLTEPDVLIIDEPFIGLDPLAIMDFEEILQEEKKKGTAILMSTHVLANAEKICDTFIILEEGKIIAQGTKKEIATAFNLSEDYLEDIYRVLVQGEWDENDVR